jgi:hypothetical protein
MTDRVEAAQDTVAKLKDKRAVAAKRVSEITKEREAVGYSVHVDQDKAARKQLDALSVEAATLDGELDSLDGAIAEAGARLEAAQADEASKEDRANAAAVRTKLKHLVRLSQQADEHLSAFGLIASEMKSTVDALHQLGQAAPTHMQMMTFCGLATGSVLMFLPWQRTSEYPHLAPRERRTFSSLFKGWADAAERSIAQRLGESVQHKEKETADA